MKDGWIKLHRQILESDIFYWKPPEWLKIWIYILLKVNYNDTKLFPRGTGFFSWGQDGPNLKGVTKAQWHKALIGLRRARQIATRKTTRGIIIKVLKYSLYQASLNPKGDTKDDTTGDSPATQGRHRGDTISKELKKDKKERTIIMSQIDNLLSQFPPDIQELTEEYVELVRIGNKTQRIALRKKKRLIAELFHEWSNCDSDLVREDFKSALRTTISNEAPHINYVRKVMKGNIRKRKIRLKRGAERDAHN